MLLVVAQQLLLVDLGEIPLFLGAVHDTLTFASFFAIGFLIYSAPRRRIRPALGTMSMIAVFALIASDPLTDPSNILRGGAPCLLLTDGVALVVATAWSTTLPRSLDGIATELGILSYPLYLERFPSDVSRRGIPTAALI